MGIIIALAVGAVIGAGITVIALVIAEDRAERRDRDE